VPVALRSSPPHYSPRSPVQSRTAIVEEFDVSQLFSLSRIARAAMVAIALGGAVVTAMPAQAAPPMHMGAQHFMPGRPMCMSDWQVRKLLQRRGYYDISLNAEMGRFIRARASKGNWVWRVDVNRCSGDIVRVTRLRHR
jgi:hypothetical protein